MSKPRPKGNLMNFKEVDGGWTLLHLDDGNYLRIKVIATKVVRTQLTNPDGTPNYWFQTSCVAVVLSPEEMQTLYTREMP